MKRSSQNVSLGCYYILKYSTNFANFSLDNRPVSHETLPIACVQTPPPPLICPGNMVYFRTSGAHN